VVEVRGRREERERSVPPCLHRKKRTEWPLATEEGKEKEREKASEVQRFRNSFVGGEGGGRLMSIAIVRLRGGGKMLFDLLKKNVKKRGERAPEEGEISIMHREKKPL